MNLFLLGAIAMGFIVAGLFFFRFWRSSHDQLFLLFAIAFWLEAANRLALALTPNPNEADPALYLIRLLAYAIIIAAIVRKNTSKTS